MCRIFFPILIWNSCWLCIHFWITWRLGKTFNTKMIGWTLFSSKELFQFVYSFRAYLLTILNVWVQSKSQWTSPTSCGKVQPGKSKNYLQTTKHHFLPSGFFHTVPPTADHNGFKFLYEISMKLGYLTIGKVQATYLCHHARLPYL